MCQAESAFITPLAFQICGPPNRPIGRCNCNFETLQPGTKHHLTYCIFLFISSHLTVGFRPLSLLSTLSVSTLNHHAPYESYPFTSPLALILFDNVPLLETIPRPPPRPFHSRRIGIAPTCRTTCPTSRFSSTDPLGQPETNFDIHIFDPAWRVPGGWRFWCFSADDVSWFRINSLHPR